MAAANFIGTTRLLRSETKFQKHGAEVEKRIKNGGHRVYQHQIDAVNKTKEMLDKDRELNTPALPVLIVAPTGSGKSGMIALLPYYLRARKVLILTPDNTISMQLAVSMGKEKDKENFFEVTKLFASEEQEELLENVLLINKNFDINDRVPNIVIVNAQKFTGKSNTTLKVEYEKKTLVKDVEKFFAQFDLLIVDEAHHYPAETWQRIVKAFKNSSSTGPQKKLVFLTATPFKKGAKGNFEPILSDNRIAYEITTRHLEGIVRNITFQEKRDVGRLCNDIRVRLEKQYIEEPRFEPQAMVLVLKKEEAVNYVKILNENAKTTNYAVAICNGQLGIDVEKQKKEFTDGKYRVAIVCGLLLEGYDNPNVTLCVILRNIGSPIIFSQFVGRCLRVNKKEEMMEENDKTNAVLLSYTKFNQREMWKQWKMLAEKDPAEEKFA